MIHPDYEILDDEDDDENREFQTLFPFILRQRAHQYIRKVMYYGALDQYSRISLHRPR